MTLVVVPDLFAVDEGKEIAMRTAGLWATALLFSACAANLGAVTLAGVLIAPRTFTAEVENRLVCGIMGATVWTTFWCKFENGVVDWVTITILPAFFFVPICVLSHNVVDEVVVLLVFGNIDKISTSGSLISVVIRLCACLVASLEPLIVMILSPCPLLCFSTSICAPVAPLMALMLLPPLPITLEIALDGTETFFTPDSNEDTV